VVVVRGATEVHTARTDKLVYPVGLAAVAIVIIQVQTGPGLVSKQEVRTKVLDKIISIVVASLVQRLAILTQVAAAVEPVPQVIQAQPV
jgi:hypothetical protein